MQRNLDMRCFARDNQVLKEEFAVSPRAVDQALTKMPAAEKCSMGWAVVPAAHRASNLYSPLILNSHATGTHGDPQCAQTSIPAGGVGGCIPAYRPGLMYIYNIVTSAWFGKGVMCIGR